MDILSESNINGIVVFRYVAIDVIEPPIADLHVNVAIEYGKEEAYKGRLAYLFGGYVDAALEVFE